MEVGDFLQNRPGKRLGGEGSDLWVFESTLQGGCGPFLQARRTSEAAKCGGQGMVAGFPLVLPPGICF